MSPPSINFLHHTVSEIWPRQDLKSQDHYSKVKLRSHNDVAHLHPQPMSLPSINFLHLTVSEIQPDKIFPAAHPPTHPSGHHGWKQFPDKKCLINILYTYALLKTFTKHYSLKKIRLTGNIFTHLYNSLRNEGYAGIVFQAFIIKCVINSIHEIYLLTIPSNLKHFWNVFYHYCSNNILSQTFLYPYLQNAY